MKTMAKLNLPGTKLPLPTKGKALLAYMLVTMWEPLYFGWGEEVLGRAGGITPMLCITGVYRLFSGTGVPRSYETPTPLGPPWVPKHRATVGS